MKKKESGVIIRTHKERMKENNKEDVKDNNSDVDDNTNTPLVIHGPQIAFSESAESLKANSTLLNTKSDPKTMVEKSNEKNAIEIENDSENLMENKISDDDREPFLGTEKDASNMGYDLFLDLN